MQVPTLTFLELSRCSFLRGRRKEEEFCLLAWCLGLGWVGSEHHLTSPGLLTQILFNDFQYYKGKNRGWLWAYGEDAKTERFLSGQLNWSKAEPWGSNSTFRKSSLMGRSSWFARSTATQKRGDHQPINWLPVTFLERSSTTLSSPTAPVLLFFFEN